MKEDIANSFMAPKEKMEYLPIEDEKKLFTLREWIELAKSELDRYLIVWENGTK